MRADELVAVFDQQAAGYDKQWARLSPILNNLYFLLEAIFMDLAPDARVLCVGAGTGTEFAHLARTFPGWRFTVVEPSKAMIDVCRQRAAAEGFADRCRFHHGYVESLPDGEMHDAATCFLVSQFILDEEARSEFFSAIASRLEPGGILASSDLASDTSSPIYDALLREWLKVMARTAVTPEGLARMRAAYARDVAILPPARVEAIIQRGGFAPPVQFCQSGLLHAWFATRVADDPSPQV